MIELWRGSFIVGAFLLYLAEGNEEVKKNKNKTVFKEDLEYAVWGVREKNNRKIWENINNGDLLIIYDAEKKKRGEDYIYQSTIKGKEEDENKSQELWGTKEFKLIIIFDIPKKVRREDEYYKIINELENSFKHKGPIQTLQDITAKVINEHKFSSNNDEIILDLLIKFKQLILYGPPGTGKTHLAKEIAHRLAEHNHKLIQFHPSYTYEDFIRSVQIRTENGNHIYETKNKIFAELCEEALQNPDKIYVLIIDEINRANLPAVLGELVYALEYRGEEVEIPYEINGNKTLVIPENLYIIGTMNTADRSAGRIDYAIRRRFIFYPLHADLDKASGEGKKLMELVNKFIEEKVSPDYDPEDVKIGHTYFMADGEKEERIKIISHKFLYQVIPLIHEYIIDGLITVDKEKGKGYKFALEDKNLYLRSGRLYNENGKPVKVEEIIDMIKK